MSRLGQQMFFARKRSGSGTDVGHEGVITGRDALSLRSSIADPQGVAQSERKSTNIHGIRNKCHTQLISC
ncbi:hypothetical protein AN161_19435 [Lysinibacillus sp. FJAT-14222]|nr:hypothetical protein AN161_19435 [Lysinibacillus sp. FJAT-14222]